MGFIGIYKQKKPSSHLPWRFSILSHTLPDQARTLTIQTFILVFLPPSDSHSSPFSQVAIKHKHFLIQYLTLGFGGLGVNVENVGFWGFVLHKLFIRCLFSFSAYFLIFFISCLFSFSAFSVQPQHLSKQQRDDTGELGSSFLISFSTSEDNPRSRSW